MKKMGLLLLLVVLGKVGYDQMMRNIEQRNANKRDEQMEQIAREIDSKLPMTGPLVKVTKVEYSKGVMRFFAVVNGEDLSAETKAEFTKASRANYCGEGKMVKFKVGIDYEVLGPPRSINDLSREAWRLSLRPENCL